MPLILTIIFIIIFIVITTTALYLKFNPQFGGSITPAHRKTYKRSEQWTGKRFRNLVRTNVDISPKEIPGLLKKQFTHRGVRAPQTPLPIKPFDQKHFATTTTQPKFVWYGHAVLLLQLDGKNLLIDPMLGPDTAPIAPIASPRFSENTLQIIDQLPHIDAVLITHDHYDHLDFASIKKLKGKVDTYFTAMGVSRHLERWGIPKEQITEFHWWETVNFHQMAITFTPTRHFSGRGLFDRANCLWGGWAFKTPTHNVYWSGDSGYGDHFKEVGKKLGPFDLAFVECGQYNKLWSQIHMFPEESVQVMLDVDAKVGVPVHWGGFTLSTHAWKEPVERFVKAAKEQDLQFYTPELGEVVELGNYPGQRAWYDRFE